MPAVRASVVVRAWLVSGAVLAGSPWSWSSGRGVGLGGSGGGGGGGGGSGGMQGGPSGVDEVVPGPAAWQPEAAASAAADDLPGDREDPQPQALWLPAAHCRGRGPGQRLGPGQEIRGERDDLEPDLVLGVAV